MIENRGDGVQPLPLGLHQRAGCAGEANAQRFGVAAGEAVVDDQGCTRCFGGQSKNFTLAGAG